jgi:hypothetical protein
LYLSRKVDMVLRNRYIDSYSPYISIPPRLFRDYTWLSCKKLYPSSNIGPWKLHCQLLLVLALPKQTSHDHGMNTSYCSHRDIDRQCARNWRTETTSISPFNSTIHGFHTVHEQKIPTRAMNKQQMINQVSPSAVARMRRPIHDGSSASWPRQRWRRPVRQ